VLGGEPHASLDVESLVANWVRYTCAGHVWRETPRARQARSRRTARRTTARSCSRFSRRCSWTSASTLQGPATGSRTVSSPWYLRRRRRSPVPSANDPRRFVHSHSSDPDGARQFPRRVTCSSDSGEQSTCRQSKCLLMLTRASRFQARGEETPPWRSASTSFGNVIRASIAPGGPNGGTNERSAQESACNRPALS